MVSTGPIEDRFTRTFKRSVFAYSVHQPIWSAQVINELVVQYTRVDKEHRNACMISIWSRARSKPSFASFSGRGLARGRASSGLLAARRPAFRFGNIRGNVSR